MRSLTVPDGGTVNVLDRLVVRCILQEPEMMPHEPVGLVPADISASIRYCGPVLPLTSVRPVSPGVRVPPHSIVSPPFASCICMLATLLTGRPMMVPLLINLLQPSMLGYAARGRAASAATAASRTLRAAILLLIRQAQYVMA